MKTYYILNKRNIIVETGDEWDRFALANGGAAAIGEQVLGHCLWDFVKGDKVRSYLNALLFCSRLRDRQISLPLRCDNRFSRLDLRMTVTPMPDGFLKVVHQQIPATSNLWRGHLSGRAHCVNCGGHWSSNTFQTICETCKTRAAEACGASPPVLPRSEIDFQDAVRIRRAALAQNDSVLPLRP